MTDRLAVILAAVIAALVIGDLALAGGTGTLYLAGKFRDLIGYVTFWR